MYDLGVYEIQYDETRKEYTVREQIEGATYGHPKLEMVIDFISRAAGAVEIEEQDLSS